MPTQLGMVPVMEYQVNIPLLRDHSACAPSLIPSLRGPARRGAMSRRARVRVGARSKARPPAGGWPLPLPWRADGSTVAGRRTRVPGAAGRLRIPDGQHASRGTPDGQHASRGPHVSRASRGSHVSSADKLHRSVRLVPLARGSLRQVVCPLANASLSHACAPVSLHHDSCAHAFTHPVSPGPTVLVPVQEETTVRIGEGGTRDLPAGSDFVLFVAYLPILGLYLFLFSELGFGATVFKTLTLHSDWAMVSASGGVCVCICARRARARARLPCARVC